MGDVLLEKKFVRQKKKNAGDMPPPPDVSSAAPPGLEHQSISPFS